jgi:AcrR family transcriptional regulator
MPATRAYRKPRRPEQAQPARERIMGAVRELLADGSFHDSTVEQVAQRAGLSRATVYQHFRSRVDLVDAICDTFADNPALVALRDTVELPEPAAALMETIANAVAFWASEDPILRELYGVAAIDPAASDLVARQRADRHGEMKRLAHHLASSGCLPAGMGEERALQLLMVLTSYESFRELRLVGLADTELVRTLQDSARALLYAPKPGG